ncbi:MAG: hypothetical protein JSR45_10810 [Proteobacteria bacterium]|nr:hypothetical protein [Pseudomonadota bacterium]
MHAAPLSPRKDGSLSRLIDADARSALRALEDSSLVDEGRVNLLGLDAIVRRLGARWPMRREQVHEHVVKVLERRLEAEDYSVRVSDNDYLVVQPRLGRFAARASCLTIMRELLTHFLGEALPTDLAVREVTALSEAGLEARLVPVAQLDADEPHSFAPAEPQAAARPGGDAPLPESRALPARRGVFLASSGRPIAVDCAIEPCFRLSETQHIGFRIDPWVADLENHERLGAEALRRFSTADLEHVDVTALTGGLARLRRDSGGAALPMLLATGSYSTLASRRGRANLLAALREASHGAAHRLICEIRNIEGVPPSMLLDAAVAVRPYCYAVIGRLDAPPDRRVRGISGCGLNGLSFDAHAADHEPLLTEVIAGIAAAKRVARSVILHGLANPDQLAAAGRAGATHASLRAEAVDPAGLTMH